MIQGDIMAYTESDYEKQSSNTSKINWDMITSMPLTLAIIRTPTWTPFASPPTLTLTFQKRRSMKPYQDFENLGGDTYLQKNILFMDYPGTASP